MSDSKNENLNQAIYVPIDNLALIETHIRLVTSTHGWTDVAIMIDDGIKAILILLLQSEQVVSILRICMSVEDSVNSIDRLRNEGGRIFFGSYQGKILTQDDICSLDRINDIWGSIQDQTTVLSIDEVRELFRRIEDESKKTGRGQNFSADTRRKVLQESHGRCMFEGCGEPLEIDDLTGIEGNFSYLAHNVASSEQGARGVPVLSEKLSDDPKNILLLCDKHHRLIDKVAAADYPAHRLSKIRQQFCATANRLLEGLGYQPIPAFSVLWPVRRDVISAPTDLQIAQSLSPLRCRMHSQLNDISDNESILRETDPVLSNRILIHSITTTADKILCQTHAYRYRAALFAFGLMPHLIALGAKIGNKNGIIPMLRYRDGGQWAWPADNPRGEFFTVTGVDELSDNEREVIVSLVLTAEPENLIKVRHSIADSVDAKSVVVKAKPEYMGNGALGHPEDGYKFTSSMQALLHHLHDRHGVERVHLLPCASNAACVFFGQAFDSHHPDILVYDFIEKSMSPILLITNNENQCVIQQP